MPRLFFLFLLFRQDGLHHIAGLGDVREINLRGDGLRSTRRRPRSARGPVATLKTRPDLLGLVGFQRARVGLAGAQAELCQYVKNLPALDFHLACEIVNSNLTHPPLFNVRPNAP